MMFEGEDCHTIQTPVENGSFTSDAHKTPIQVWNAIQTTIKEEEHVWQFREKIIRSLADTRRSLEHPT